MSLAPAGHRLNSITTRKVIQMKQMPVMKATLGRIPLYLQYLRSLPASECRTTSATAIAKAMGLGEVQVRKDLGAVVGTGRPKIGYVTSELISGLESFLGSDDRNRAVLVGAGKLGKALLDYDGFSDYGIKIIAAFDNDGTKTGTVYGEVKIYPMAEMEDLCRAEDIRIGIITVPKSAAREVCGDLLHGGITAIWNFAPILLDAPKGILVQQENLALSLAYLSLQVKEKGLSEPPPV